jgi:hypothetical protein
MSVLKLCSSVDLQQCRLISYFHNFLSYNHYFRKCFKLEYRKNVFIVALTTGISYSLAYMFGCGEFYGGVPRVPPPPVKWSGIAEILRKTGLQ